MQESSYYRTWLASELARRSERNQNYSLRAFAKSVEIDAGLLSKIIANKRKISLTMAYKLAEKVGLDPLERRQFLQSVIDERMPENVDLRDTSGSPKPEHLEEDVFKIIADLYHYAILEMTYVKNFQGNAKWIASQLGITTLEVRLALERLQRLGLLKRVNGKWVKTNANLTTANKALTSAAHIRHQRQALQKAIESLENDPIEIRNMTSMTLPTDPKKVAKAKEMIGEFMEKLADFLEAGPKKNVYQLTVSLFPLQKDGT